MWSTTEGGLTICSSIISSSDYRIGLWQADVTTGRRNVSIKYKVTGYTYQFLLHTVYCTCQLAYQHILCSIVTRWVLKGRKDMRGTTIDKWLNGMLSPGAAKERGDTLCDAIPKSVVARQDTRQRCTFNFKLHRNTLGVCGFWFKTLTDYPASPSTLHDSIVWCSYPQSHIIVQDNVNFKTLYDSIAQCYSHSWNCLVVRHKCHPRQSNTTSHSVQSSIEGAGVPIVGSSTLWGLHVVAHLLLALSQLSSTPPQLQPSLSTTNPL